MGSDFVFRDVVSVLLDWDSMHRLDSVVRGNSSVGVVGWSHGCVVSSSCVMHWSSMVLSSCVMGWCCVVNRDGVVHRGSFDWDVLLCNCDCMGYSRVGCGIVIVLFFGDNPAVSIHDDLHIVWA